MVLRAHTQTIAQFSRGFWPPCIFWTPAKCEVAHTSFPFSPSKVQHRDIYLAPGGVHGTETKTSHRIYGRNGSCNGVDYPSGHDVGGPRFGCAELVSDVPSSTFAVVLGGPQAAPRIERRAPWLTRMIAPEDSSAPPSAAQLPSSVAASLINRVNAPTRRASAPARRGRHLPRRGRRRPDPSRGRDAQIGRPKNDCCRH